MAHELRFLAGRPVNVGFVSRAELLGQGVFETMRWQGGIPLLPWHIHRLKQGAQQLGYGPDQVATSFLAELEQVTADLELHRQHVVRYQLSHVQAERGYAAKAGDLTSLWQVSDAPQTVVSCVKGVEFDPVAMTTDPLSVSKHVNRLDQVLAAQRCAGKTWLRCDAQGYVREGLSSNLFFSRHGIVYTPRLEHWGVAGVLRAWLIDYLRTQKIPVVIGDFLPSAVLSAESVWLTNAVRGIQLIENMGTTPFSVTSPLVTKVREAVFELFYENP
ncbi:aminotransferase class IV [Salinispirillum marinum]|uniref:Aminotransferase class IV n=2 Tax=Saccharospirillaceae TaxID=255527 RepID=A0ABV8BDT2_9GAMM